MVTHAQDPRDRLKILVSAVQSRPCPASLRCRACPGGHRARRAIRGRQAAV